MCVFLFVSLLLLLFGGAGGGGCCCFVVVGVGFFFGFFCVRACLRACVPPRACFVVVLFRFGCCFFDLAGVLLSRVLVHGDII